MIKKILQTTILLSVSVLSVSANAALIESGSNSITNKSTSTNLWEIFHQLVFPQFDTQGGLRQLLSVELTFTGTSNGSLTFTNNGATAASYSAQTTANMDLSSLNDAGVSSNSLIFVTAGGTTPFDPTYSSGTLAAGGGTSTIAVTDLAQSGSLVFGPSKGGLSLSDFVGTGNMTTYLSSQVLVSSATSSDYTVSGSFTTDGSIGYVYNYQMTSVPEPTSIAVFGLALCVAGLVRRKM